jgi:hypothetical protein
LSAGAKPGAQSEDFVPGSFASPRDRLRHMTSHLTRTLNALGLKREPVDVTPVLNEYLSTLPAETQDLAAAADESEG